MKMFTKIILLIFLSGTLIAPTFISATYIEQSGFEDTTTSSCVSMVDIQGHAIYNDNDQGGKTNFGIWTAGEYDVAGKITVKLYVTAYYDRVTWSERTGRFYEQHYWDPIPSGFMTWNGVYDYNNDGSYIWSWRTGASVYGFSYSLSHTEEPTASKASANSVSGDYRYLGYFCSNHDDDQDFKAFLKLFLDNDMAKDYANGHEVVSGDYHSIYYISKIRVKLEFQFTFQFLIWTITSATHTHIMGDGAGDADDHDLNYIALVEGTIE